MTQAKVSFIVFHLFTFQIIQFGGLNGRFVIRKTRKQIPFLLTVRNVQTYAISIKLHSIYTYHVQEFEIEINFFKSYQVSYKMIHQGIEIEFYFCDRITAKIVNYNLKYYIKIQNAHIDFDDKEFDRITF